MPSSIIITNGGSSYASQVDVAFADAAPTSIAEQTLENTTSDQNAHIVLEATDTINISNLTDNILTLNSGVSLTLRTQGGITMDASDTIFASGGGNIILQGTSDITIGGLKTDGGNILIEGGDIRVNGLINAANNGTITINVAGNFSLNSPGSILSTSDSINSGNNGNITIKDGSKITSGDASVGGNISINAGVINLNQAPTAQDDTVTTISGKAVNIEVLTNDRDDDNDVLSLSIVSVPNNGTAQVNDNGTPNDQSDDSIVYTPAPDFSGTDQFIYQIDDGKGGTDTAKVTLNINGLSQNASNKNLLQLTSPNNSANLLFTLTDKNLETEIIHEVAVFAVEDDRGRVNGLLPSDSGYLTAALSQAQVIFSVIPDDFVTNPRRILSNLTSNNLALALLQDLSLDKVLNNPDEFGTRVFFSTENNSVFNINQLENGYLSLSVEDQLGDRETDLTLSVQITDENPPLGTNIQGQEQGELLDLRDLSDRQLQAVIPLVESEAAFDNLVGFYVIENEQGKVIDPLTSQEFNPGDDGYMQAALRSSRELGFNFNDRSAGISFTIEGGQLLAPFIVADGTIEQILDENPDNNVPTYFAYLGANSDRAEHIRLLGDNIWGFEDLPNSGDRDFNDVVIKVEVNVV